MHLALKFTFEKEKNDQLLFLDVLVEKSNDGFLTSVFRKPTFTGQYFRLDRFGHTKRKTNLIETLNVHRALIISSKSKLQHELENISSILRNNGYPESIIQTTISKKIALFIRKPKEGPQKCPVYLKLLRIGKISSNFKNKPRLLSTDITKLMNLASFLQPEKFCLQFIKMFYFSLSCINTCAAVTVGMWIKLPKDYRTKFINTFRDAKKRQKTNEKFA